MKRITVKRPGNGTPAAVSCQGRSRQAVVVGADTDMGRALSNSLWSVGFQIIGLGEAADCVSRGGFLEYRRTDYSSFGVPDECNLVLYCHDAAADARLHVSGLEALCCELAANRTEANQVHVCVFTPAGACAPSVHIREDAALLPHSLRELACVQAEMVLHAWCYRSRNAILPQIFRHGEIYGIRGGHVDACLRRAASGQELLIPGMGNQRRTLTHVDDLAAATAALLKDDLTPSPINLPGENMTVIEYMGPVADRFGMGLAISQEGFSEDLPWGVGDHALSSALFKSEVADFKPQYRFKSWLAAGPRCEESSYERNFRLGFPRPRGRGRGR